MSKGSLKAFKRAGRTWCASCNSQTCQRSMSMCQKNTWFVSDPLMIERLLLMQSSPNRTWPGCSEWLSSWPATIWVCWTAPAQDHNYLCSNLKGLTQDLRGLMTCRSRWTIGMQRLEGLSNLRLNKSRDGRDLKCRMRQSRSREKKSCACKFCLEFMFLTAFLTAFWIFDMFRLSFVFKFDLVSLGARLEHVGQGCWCFDLNGVEKDRKKKNGKEKHVSFIVSIHFIKISMKIFWHLVPYALLIAESFQNVYREWFDYIVKIRQLS